MMAKGTRKDYFFWPAAAAASLATIAGCATPHNEPARLLKTEDFITDRARLREVARSPVPTEYGPGWTIDEPRSATPGPAPVEPAERAHAAPEQDAAEIFDVGLRVGAPVVAGAAEPLESPYLIDAKVGEINGRPIRAEDVLAEVGPRLAAMRRMPNMTRARWTDESRQVIRAWLDFVLEDQLLVAEARASLRPEQQMGLRHMVADWSENMRRESGGSRAAAEQRAQEANTTIRQMERDREAQILVRYQIEERIRNRVRVSWKDVRLYHERNTDQSAAARYRLIRIPGENAEAIAEVERELASGRPFAEVATMAANAFRREEGGLRTPDVEFTGDYATAELNLAAPLASAARELKPGEWTARPVEQGGHQNWIFLERIERRGRPLSDRDVQLRIAHLLNLQALNTERQAYIERLKERASYTDLDEMSRRLIEIAADRYWPRG